MKKSNNLVLKNKQGQSIRNFESRSKDFILVYREDTRRVEGFSSLSELDQNNIPYTVLLKTTIDDVSKKDIHIDKVGTLTASHENSSLPPSHDLSPEDNHPYFIYLKWTSIVQVASVLIILILGYFFKPDFIIPQPQLVTVVPQQKEVAKVTPPPPTKKRTPPPPTRVHRKRVVAPTKKKVKNKSVAQASSNRASRRKVSKSPRPAPKLNQLGALAAIGNLNKKARGMGNFNYKSKDGGIGYGSASGGGVGGKNGAGLAKSVYGKGLIAGTPGNGGSRAHGAGGYGTRGKGGGGQGGYGKHSLVGSAKGNFEPGDEEMIVEGGLGRDQIADVINRNMGQIIYCYEQGLQVKPSLTGRVVMKFTISPKGRVSTAGVSNSSLNSSLVEKCMVSKLKGWSFPQPVGNVSVKVTYPFSLRRIAHN